MTQADWKLIETTPTVELATVNKTGYPCVRAMLNLRCKQNYPSLVSFFNQQEEPLFYFTTNTSSRKMEELSYSSKACIYFSNPQTWHGVTIQGTLSAITDIFQKVRFWQHGWEMYYPGGPEDPDYSLLVFTPVKMKSYFQLNLYEEKF